MFNMPHQASTYNEKCRLILIEMESVIKQYSLYVEDGLIDYDLINISSSQLDFDTCFSLNTIKYIYSLSENYPRLRYLLFSDQCMLNYPSPHTNKFRTFFEVLQKTVVGKSNYPEYLHNEIDWLECQGVIKISESNEIFISDQPFLYVLYDLYKNEVISYHNLPTVLKRKVDELIKTGFLRSDNHLFSKPEQDYFNFHLNRRYFGNTLDLRNSYLHGSQIYDEENSEKHYNNYLIILKLLLLTMIKIIDDLEIRNALE